MRIGVWVAALMALCVVGEGVPRAAAQAAGEDYPYQGHVGFALDATVSQVDADRDRVVVRGDDGKTYTVDTYRIDIKLRDTARAGQTGDLVPGMRLHITGTLLSSDLIESEQVSVLPFRGSVNPPAVTRSDSAAGQKVTLRGTVESVDDHQGSFVVRVSDHTRTVFVDDRTDLDDFNVDVGDHLPFHAGDRVSVVGKLADDGTVQAALVTPKRLDNEPVPDAEPAVPAAEDASHGRTLLGRVSKESDYFSRDIKIRVSVDREITIRVPKNIPIRRGDRALSVHDLKDDQVVRVTGDYDDADFQADHIEVLPDAAGDSLDF